MIKDILRKFEGLKLKAYLDGAGVPTIGYGHIKGVKLGDTCTIEQAEKWLDEELIHFENGVRKLVTTKINENQFAALVSFAYNLGLSSLEHSTLLKLLNRPAFDKYAVADQFLRWNKIKVNGELVVSKGLTSRRQAEKELFLK